jgi:hypothetical protein
MHFNDQISSRADAGRLLHNSRFIINVAGVCDALSAISARKEWVLDRRPGEHTKSHNGDNHKAHFAVQIIFAFTVLTTDVSDSAPSCRTGEPKLHTYVLAFSPIYFLFLYRLFIQL